MDLAIATGRGPKVVADIEGRRPLVRDEDAAVFAHRDAAEAAAQGSQPLPAAMLSIDLAEVRRRGAEAAAREAVAHLAREDLAGFWIHLDADVLDDAIMPAVDYRIPGGLSWDEVAEVIAAAASSGRMAGLDVTIFNPALDPTGAIATTFVDTIVAGLHP
jgi:arginase